jgi:hypothetical protein
LRRLLEVSSLLQGQPAGGRLRRPSSAGNDTVVTGEPASPFAHPLHDRIKLPDCARRLLLVRDPKSLELLQTLRTLPPAELRAVISEVFGFASYEGERTINYSSPRGPALTLSYTRKGAINDLQLGPYFSEDDADSLRNVLDKLKGGEVHKVYSLFFFSTRPVKGWWRCRDSWQIVPPPKEAPLPGELLGHWPFIVEVKTSWSEIGRINIQRRMQPINHVGLLLPLLLKGPIFQPRPYSPQKHWVILPGQITEENPNPTPHFVQEFYTAPGHTGLADAFTELDEGSRLAVESNSTKYYNQLAISVDESLEIPEILPRLLDNYYALPPEDQKRYLRSCYWFGMGQFIGHYSFSMSFVAYVTAIETLLIDSDRPHTCPACGENHYPSKTAAFRSFLERYVPDAPARETFYARRSDLAHGSSVLDSDVRDEFDAFYPNHLDDNSEYAELTRTCRVSLVNWLDARSGSSEST